MPPLSLASQLQAFPAAVAALGSFNEGCSLTRAGGTDSDGVNDEDAGDDAERLVIQQ
jgi:hypothetical protein